MDFYPGQSSARVAAQLRNWRAAADPRSVLALATSLVMRFDSASRSARISTEREFGGAATLVEMLQCTVGEANDSAAALRIHFTHFDLRLRAPRWHSGDDEASDHAYWKGCFEQPSLYRWYTGTPSSQAVLSFRGPWYASTTGGCGCTETVFFRPRQAQL